MEGEEPSPRGWRGEASALVPARQHIANLALLGHPGTAYGPFQLPRSLREGEVIESAPDSPARRSLMAGFAALSRKGHTKPRTNNNGR